MEVKDFKSLEVEELSQIKNENSDDDLDCPELISSGDLITE